MKISIIQRRFLIIWIAIHTIALLTNIIPIRGEYSVEGDRCFSCTKSMYIFAAPIYTDQQETKFWPFTNIYDQDGYGYGSLYFRGIFFSYGFGEFIFYILTGFAIVFLPRLWNGKE